MHIKSSLLIFAMLFFANNFYSQVGIGTTNPSPAAMLEVSSQSNGIGDYKGFMPPRVPNVAARDGIAPGASDYGLMVYVLDNGSGHSCLQLWVGDSWVDVRCNLINTPPVATDVEFSGGLQIGETLTASFTYTDADADPAGAHTYTWYLASDALGTGQTVAQTGTSDTYVSVLADDGKYLAVEVTPVATSGESLGIAVLSDYRGPLGAPAIVWPAVQNFETTAADPELLLLSATGGSYFTGNNSGRPTTSRFVSAVRGYGVNNGTATVELGPIDVSSSTDATFKLRLGAFSKSSGNGMEANDTVIVSISTDGGTSFSKELQIQGASNEYWGFDALRSVTTTYDGNGTPVSFTSGSGNNATTGGISYLEITGIPNSSTLVIKIEMINNADGEIWVIDDAEIWGN